MLARLSGLQSDRDSELPALKHRRLQFNNPALMVSSCCFTTEI
jgi:hypothetical protein